MSQKQFAVFGVYSNFQALRTGVDTLKAVGVRIVDISVLFPESAVARTLPRQSDVHPIVRASGKKKPVIEPLIGGTLGWLACINPQGRDIVSGALMSLGVPNDEADRYEERIQNGSLLMCVRSSALDGMKLATEILAHTGAADVTHTQGAYIESDAAQNHSNEDRVTQAAASNGERWTGFESGIRWGKI